MIDKTWRDVSDFHAKFHLPQMAVPTPLHRLPGRLGAERVRHMQEEFDELATAAQCANLADQADALVDIVYVAVGTARMMGLPWGRIWDAVHAANMGKASDEATAKRVVKPAGWVSPKAQIERAIAEARGTRHSDGGTVIEKRLKYVKMFGTTRDHADDASVTIHENEDGVHALLVVRPRATHGRSFMERGDVNTVVTLEQLRLLKHAIEEFVP